MADADADKGGGFGSLPGDLFDEMIKYFETTLSPTLEADGKKVLAQLARTEHAAANAKKAPYVVDVVFKCLSIKPLLIAAKDGSLPDPARQQAMKDIVDILQSLKTLWG
jgi:hypothetical protein